MNRKEKTENICAYIVFNIYVRKQNISQNKKNVYLKFSDNKCREHPRLIVRKK